MRSFLFAFAIASTATLAIPVVTTGTNEGNPVQANESEKTKEKSAYLPSLAVLQDDGTWTITVDGFKIGIDGIISQFTNPLSFLATKEVIELTSEYLSQPIKVTDDHGTLKDTFEKQVLIKDPFQNANGKPLIPFSPSDGGVSSFWIATKATGFGVVSSVFDTLKPNKDITLKNVNDAHALAVETFAALKALPDTSFHYITSSNKAVFTEMTNFLDERFPVGTLHFRSITPLQVLQSAASLKQDYIKSLVEITGKKKFILIGNGKDGEIEAYSKAVEQFPERIQCVYIVTHGIITEDQRKEILAPFGSFAGLRVIQDLGGIVAQNIQNGSC